MKYPTLKWIPVKEKLPPEDEIVLAAVYDVFGRYFCTYIAHRGKYGWITDDEFRTYLSRDPSYWMPLPKAPETNLN